MLQKIENAYLGTLRFVAILVATALLAGAVLYGISSTRALQPEQPLVAVVPKVADADLKAKIHAPQRRGGQTSEDAIPEMPSANDADAYLRRAGDAVTTLIRQVNPNVDADRIHQAVNSSLRPKAKRFDAQGLEIAYLKGIAGSLERVLKDPEALAELKQPHESGDSNLFERLFDAYDQAFAAQVTRVETENANRRMADAERKTTAQQHFYIAAGSFGLFLAVVFLSIIIRIERNLRPVPTAAHGGQV